MGMTAIVLILLALSVKGMSWIDVYINRRQAAQAEVETAEVETPVTDAQVAAEDESDGAKRAAAIAVAIALARRSQESTHYQGPTNRDVGNSTPYDSWVSEGRARLRSTQGVAQGSTRWR